MTASRLALVLVYARALEWPAIDPDYIRGCGYLARGYDFWGNLTLDRKRGRT